MVIPREKIEARRDAWRDKLSDELKGDGVARLLRRETWSGHERAEHSAFEVALGTGQLTHGAYAALLAQVYPVYGALEERSEQLKDDPIAGQLYIPELHRTANLELDLAFYLGETWRQAIDPLPVTAEYIARIRTVPPVRFVAHHYNRYLADLSGGLIICAVLKKVWGLDGDGLRYYEFPEIGDPVEFKNGYRGTLDALPLDPEQKLDLIEEVALGYEFNIAMVKELARLHLPAELRQVDAAATATHH